MRIMFYNFTKIERFSPLFHALEKCKGVEQGEDNHPEGDVFVHSIQVLQWAFRESQDVDLILAALLHDVGKQVNTLGHDKYGVQMLQGHISPKTEWLIGQHMRVRWMLSGMMRKRSKVLELVSHVWLPDAVLLSRWDKMGRNPQAKITYDRVLIVDRLLKLQQEGSDAASND